MGRCLCAPGRLAMQEAFQPSSTPMVKGRGYLGTWTNSRTHTDAHTPVACADMAHFCMVLAWNMVGLIVCRDEGGDHAIDIEYHDRGARRPLHRTDPHRSTLGALSTHGLALGHLGILPGPDEASTDEHAVVLASPKRSRDGSLLQVLPTGTWAANADWQARLDGDEQVTGVAVGTGWCAAATSAAYLRLYSLAGIPLAVLSVPGTIVAIAGSDRYLLVAHHRGPPTDRMMMSWDRTCMAAVVVSLMHRCTYRRPVARILAAGCGPQADPGT